MRLGDGNVRSASVAVNDKAGNSANATVSGIAIDRHAPDTSADVPTEPASGWYADDVSVVLTGVDGLSGLASTFYKFDGGITHLYAGAFLDTLRGTHTITFWSSDRAGNVED